MAPRFIGPFPISQVVNPSAVRLRLILCIACLMSTIGVMVSSTWWTGRATAPEERCWVPAWDILDPSLITDFRRQHPVPPTVDARRRL
uniref:Uncharacterized protein n=1 Tax=Anguilla anguilla TaxID=7936 RepID=A0A0E9RCM7_ANGAN